MPADASIYGNVQTPQINIPNPMDMAAKSMQLSQLGMQQMQMARQLQTQSAIQSAYMHNTDPATGQLDQAGYLSDLGRMSPMAAQQETGRLAEQNKQVAESKAAQLDAQQKTLSLTGPAFDLMAQIPEDKRAAVYPKVIDQLKGQGVDTSRMDHPYDPGLFNQYLQTWRNSKQGLENQVAQSTIAKNLAEAGPMAQAKLQGEVYGSRSPTVTLADQFNAEPGVKGAKSSQVTMQQMLDSYGNKTPQGDASLVLNNFRIRNPGVPDVNSIDEMKSSEAVGPTWKNKLNQAISGGFDQPTRDDLIRDGISAYRANMDTLSSLKDQYRDTAKFRGVTDHTIFNTPAADKTSAATTALQKNIGPYVTPAQRGGIMGAVNGLLSKVTGTGGDQSASAASPSGTIKMMSPNGKIKMVPIGMKGEAIAAGGKVVQ